MSHDKYKVSPKKTKAETQLHWSRSAQLFAYSKMNISMIQGICLDWKTSETESELQSDLGKSNLPKCKSSYSQPDPNFLPSN